MAERTAHDRSRSSNVTIDGDRVGANISGLSIEQFPQNPILQELLARQDFDHVEAFREQVRKADLFEGSPEYLLAELDSRLQAKVFGPLRESQKPSPTIAELNETASDAHAASLEVVSEMKDELKALEVHKMAKVLKLQMLEDIKNSSQLSQAKRDELKEFVLQQTIDAKREIEATVFNGLDFSQISTVKAIEGTEMLYQRLLAIQAEISRAIKEG